MEEDQILNINFDLWNDPLLLTDVSWQQQQNISSDQYYSSNNSPNTSPSSVSVTMADSALRRDSNDGLSWKNQSFEANDMRNFGGQVSNDSVDGKSMLGFSLTSPDLVICGGGSPDIFPKVDSYGDSPEILERSNCKYSTEVSLENGIKGSDSNNNNTTLKTPTVRFSSFNKELSPESSLELHPPLTAQEDSPEGHIPVVSIDADFGESQEVLRMSQGAVSESPKDGVNCEVELDYEKLKGSYEYQKKELVEARRVLEELRMENQLKSKECREAWNSLQELQNELMRKSMHVGSLAFAIEGQVKEKSRWFSSLRDLTRRLKIMQMEHIKLAEEASTYKKCLADMNEMSSIVQSEIKHQVDMYEHLKIQFVEGTKERKELYNKVLELKGNIRVFCRCRPLNTEEIAAGSVMTIDFESAKDSELTVMSNGAPRKTFKFDAVFGPQADQADVFKDTAPFATSVLDGYNVCIFAYGQTGTGKTFTMEGTNEARGVNFRTLEELFRTIKEREKLYRYDISVSVLEVYNEQIRDLLVVGSQPGATSKRLEVRQTGEGIHHVPGLVEAPVSNISEVWEVLQTGSNARAVGATNANEHSSRSHCLHCVMVKGENLLNGEHTKSKLWLVDLAGSERVAKTEVQGERLKETQNINRSLSALGDVISALATKSPHIPFRNSKLTHLLQDSLGGDSKTLMFVQVSPSENDFSETLCSLNFASRVRGIELGPAKKQIDNSEFLRYKQMVEKTKQELKSKDVQSKKMEETIHGLDLKLKDKDLKIKSLQDKVKELEQQLLVERKLARQHVDTKIAEQHLKQQQDEQTTAPPRPPLVSRVPGLKNSNEPASINTMIKEQANLARPLMENNNYKPPILLPPTDGIVKYINPTEKENNPEMAEQPRLLPKRTGRASLGPAIWRIPAAPAPRRNSLIPLSTAPTSAQIPPALLPLPTRQDDEKEESDGSLPEQIVHCNSPKGIKSGSKKLSSILRRSLQKKMQMKTPMQQHFRRGGVNVGMERVRISIGSRGRMAHRVLLGSGRRGGTKEIPQKQSHKDKERGWNIGTVSRI
ncbi:kinesin-like protein KIN-14Q isoform X2 [Pistacia vera]|uniref:kinesin-like protein KIN-14Q isoform X2 n=1 Tax=Pistacia vera TaxID=55513 RepID=UPI0012637D09|nr:kinesin-like protein KIN-14Q isoform X2 [Pistacia vera]